MTDISIFFNRLQKNFRHWAKWAKRRSISCYRVYDRDVPEFPVALDLYEQRAHLQEFDTGWQIGEDEHALWVESVRAAASEVLALPLSAISFKQRRRQRGLLQYEKTGARGEDFVVHEGGHRFIVNLEEYLDTGLFLDHRITRQLLRELAAGKRFLNLFGYTGAATVHAVLGGAARTTTVDSSVTYLDWARRNLELNGFHSPRHELIRADCRQWLIWTHDRYDLIFLDPPTFSNSKRLEGTFDVQRDHVELIRQTLRLLAPDGVLIFSTNARKFRLDTEALSDLHIEDWSLRTLPPDFARDPKIHQCWRLTRP